jgi:N-acetylmuramoyl-L-alanine amidase
MLDIAIICLTAAIYHEARGEPLIGQRAVAEVIINRVESKHWPNTICEVVKQKNQFSFYDEKNPKVILNWEAEAVAFTIASNYIIYGSQGIVSGATCYTTLEINNSWTQQYQVLKKIGSHKFIDCLRKKR